MTYFVRIQAFLSQILPPLIKPWLGIPRGLALGAEILTPVNNSQSPHENLLKIAST